VVATSKPLEAALTYHKPAAEPVQPVQQVSHQAPVDPEFLKALETLQYGSQAAEREQAIASLARLGSQDNHPQAVHVLLSVCRLDSSAAVRAGCVRCLADLNARSPEVISTLKALLADPSHEVRQEVLQALRKLEQ
jgi:HEAT repeat protein